MYIQSAPCVKCDITAAERRSRGIILNVIYIYIYIRFIATRMKFTVMTNAILDTIVRLYRSLLAGPVKTVCGQPGTTPAWSAPFPRSSGPIISHSINYYCCARMGSENKRPVCFWNVCSQNMSIIVTPPKTCSQLGVAPQIMLIREPCRVTNEFRRKT